MLLPSSWNRLKRKRLSVIEDDCHEVQDKDPLTEVDVTYLNGIITRRIQNPPPVPEAPEDWQWLLSKISIATMLQSTTQPPKKGIPIVTRKYEESFMR